jgi:integrase
MRTRKPPRLVHWKGQWHLFHFDRATGKAKRVRCDALGAITAQQREKLELRAIERDMRERLAAAGIGHADEFDMPVIKALNEFRLTIDEREKARKRSPREGLSHGAAYMLRAALDNFEAWLRRTGRVALRCGSIDGPILDQWSTSLAASGKATATANIFRDRLRTCLRWLSRRRPRVLPDPEILWPSLRLRHVEPRAGVAFAPAELQAFLARARKPTAPAKVKRKRAGKMERFRMRTLAVVTPVDRLFLLLALTGCRLGEALAMKWEDVDLDRARVTIRASKTGRTRVLPLARAPEGAIAPRFLTALKAWRQEKPKAVFVLPHRGASEPVYSRRAWDRAQRNSGITPQALRRNFTSYAASLGIPASVCALWQGHSMQVAEDHYRQQVLERKRASSMEAAMGLVV